MAEIERDHPRLTPAVQVLIATNVAMLVLQSTVVSAADTVSWLGFDATALPGRWWSILTYPFVHANAWQVVVNLYALVVFGPRLEHGWGGKRFTWFYLLCGLGGAVFHALLVRGGPMVGASAAVFGVMTAYAMQWPDDELLVFGVAPIHARALVGILLAIGLAIGLIDTSGGANVAAFAHLGGILAAYLYMRIAMTGGMDQVRQRVANVPDADEPPRAIPRSLPRSRDRGDETDDVVAKSKAIVAKRPVRLNPLSRRSEGRADELNRVLDKISEQGIESLTQDERKVLEEMSRKLRGT